mmetsp:Transcript_115047/g.229080  ORF Transcript_115047/g.229080 Transcript_115047/m.229080 type:complete len:328 (-) Transcript_115047:24-1007(-)
MAALYAVGLRRAAAACLNNSSRLALGSCQATTSGASVASKVQRCSAGLSEGATGASSSLSTTANSYISLGTFETMGSSEGRMATGISYLQDLIRVQETEHSGEADPKRRAGRGLTLAQSLLQMGRQHHQQQDPVEALNFYQRAADLVMDAIGIWEQQPVKPKKGMEYSNFFLSEVQSSLGVAYNDLGRTEDALDAHQKALTLRKDTVGKGHASLAECFNNLGALYFARGALQKAVEHYEQALDLLVEAVEGRLEGPYVALTLYNIGVCRGGLGQPQVAVSSLKKALAIAERAFGSGHRQVELIRETLQKGPPVAARAAGKQTSEPTE